MRFQHETMAARFSRAALVAFTILTASPTVVQAAGNHDQPIVAGGMEIFYGVIPAQIILGHPADHPERKMHGGMPPGAVQDHLVVSLFDAIARRRIVDAKVQATITGGKLPAHQKLLEPMQFAGATTYGNYFRISPPGPVRIELEVQRPGVAQPVNVVFEYSHPRGGR